MGAMTQHSDKESKPLAWVLAGLCRDYDCFLTIEGGWQEGESGNKFEVERASRILEKVGLVAELEQLRQTVPNFSYEFDPENPRVVHFIDTRLKEQEGYGLQGTIKSLDFTGTLDDLLNAIGKQGIPVSPQLGRYTHEPWDSSTVVNVKGEGLSVRNALSNFVKLDGRDRILWVARTKLEPKAVSYVYYPWPGHAATTALSGSGSQT
jgi:hypothetical protein